MDSATIDWVLTDQSLHDESSTPNSALVFMLYYGLELRHFLLKMSDHLITKYPLQKYNFEKTYSYLAGSAAHGFFLNTNIYGEVKDFDLVSVLKKGNIRHYDQDDLNNSETASVVSSETEHTYDSAVNETGTSEPSYLIVETWEDTPPGYVMLRKCKRHQRKTGRSLADYISSNAVMNARKDFWNRVKSDIKQNDIDKSNERKADYVLFSYVDRTGPAVNAYLSHSKGPMTTTVNTDMVFALPYPGWPQISNEWRTRERPSRWPSVSLQNAILNSGCEIVPSGDNYSKRTDYEWKISFSHGEMLLSRSLIRVQRELVHILKAILPETSYNIINIMYRQCEQIDQTEWTSVNIAKMMFHLLDVYIECIKNKQLPHYFVSERNLLDKLKYETIEMNSEDSSTAEYIESILYEFYKLKKDPLGRLLGQDSYLGLPEYLYRQVFTPFVKEIKENGNRNRKIYINTLVMLSKAHFSEGNWERAYLYSQDAISMYSKLDSKECKNDVIVELFLTTAICSHIQGNFVSVFESLQKLEPLIPDMGELCPTGREYYLLMFARHIAIGASKLGSGELYSITKSKEMYSSILNKIKDPDLSLFLESAGFYMFLGQVSKVDEILSKLSQLLFHEDESEDVTILYEREPQESRYSTKDYIAETDTFPNTDSEMHETFIFDQPEENIYTNKEYIEGTDDIFESVEHHPGSIQFTSLKTTFPNTDSEMSESFIFDQPEDVEILYEREPQESKYSNKEYNEETDDMFESVNRHSENMQFTSFQTTFPNTEGDMQESLIFDQSQNNYRGMRLFSTTETTSVQDMKNSRLCDGTNPFGDEIDSVEVDPHYKMEDFNLLNTYYFERCKLANDYKQIGMHKTANDIFCRVKRKFMEENPESTQLFDSVFHFSKTLWDDKTNDQYDSTEWQDILHNYRHFLIYGEADVPILDDILSSAIERKGSFIRLRHKVAFLHYMIECQKLQVQIENAKSYLKLLEDIIEPNDKDGNLLLGCHFEFFHYDIKAELAFEIASQEKSRTVQEEVKLRIEQLMKFVSEYELKNSDVEHLFETN